MPLLIFVLLSASTGLFAAETDAKPVADPLGSESLLRLAGGMLLVLALVFGAAWLLRRLQRMQNAATGQLRIVAGLSVGQRERVLVVQVGEQQLLLGVAPGTVKKLHELPQPLELSRSETTAPFAAELRKLLKNQEAEA
jgi:flagellar protein FliO/FliZ